MKRFIFLSFAFLGLGFYELSGGADFDPIAARDAAVLARTDVSDDLAPSKMSAEPAIEMASADLEDQVTRVSLNLVSFGEATQPQERVQQRPTPSPTAEPAPEQATAATFSTTEDTATVLPSLIFPGNTLRASSDAVSLRQDVRFVTGDRVNMRGGPGTGFDVVTQLLRDTQVEVLQDDGSGWVKLRPVEGGPEGWIADFLLSNS